MSPSSDTLAMPKPARQDVFSDSNTSMLMQNYHWIRCQSWPNLTLRNCHFSMTCFEKYNFFGGLDATFIWLNQATLGRLDINNIGGDVDLQNTKQHKLSAAQICGWIVWWVITIVVLALAIFMLTRTTDAAGVHNSWNYHMIAIFLLLVYGIQQIIAFFGIKRLHYNERYVWPIVLIVLGVLGSFLYVIPGIWGLIVNNPQKNQPTKIEWWTAKNSLSY